MGLCALTCITHAFAYILSFKYQSRGKELLVSVVNDSNIRDTETSESVTSSGTRHRNRTGIEAESQDCTKRTILELTKPDTENRRNIIDVEHVINLT